LRSGFFRYILLLSLLRVFFVCAFGDRSGKVKRRSSGKEFKARATFGWVFAGVVVVLALPVPESWL